MNRWVLRSVHAIGALAMAAGIACLSYVATVWLQAREHERSFDVTAPPPLARTEGAAIGEVRLERIGLYAVVSEGDTDAVLDLGPGHLPDTPWLDRPGNIVIAGHRDASFRPLRHVRDDDIIVLQGLGASRRYRVTSTEIVAPTDLSVLKPGAGNSLTLITCYPFYFIGHAPKRFVVRADEIR